MNKKTIITLLLVLVTLTGWAKEKAIVWEQPTTEFGNSYGDGFFNLCLDVTKVELKDNETVVYITAQQRSDYPDYWFQFAGDTYLEVVRLYRGRRTGRFPNQGHQACGGALETTVPLLLARQ